MILAVQVVLEITGHNIVAMYPAWDVEYTYTVEPLGVIPTYRSVARVDRHLHRSTIDGNLGNDPTATLVTTWVYYRVSNIYALLDYDETTKTTWYGEDGMLEFRKGVATLLAMGALSLGAVQVSFMESKTGVLDGFSLSGVDGFYLTRGGLRVDGEYTRVNVNYTFGLNILKPSRDNYIYPKPPLEGVNLREAKNVAVDTTTNIAYVIGENTNGKVTLTSIDISDSNQSREIGSLVLPSLTFVIDIDIVEGNAVFIASSIDNILISVDISTPEAMEEKGSFSHTDIKGIAIYESVAFITSVSLTSITSVDIVNIEHMFQISTKTDASLNGGGKIAISSAGTEAYIVTGLVSNSLLSVDISDETNMSVVDTFTHASFSYPIDVEVDGNNVYVVNFTGNGITSVDATTPSALSYLDNYSNVSIANPLRISIYGTVAYLVCSLLPYSITAINIATPSTLALLDIFEHFNILNPVDVIALNNKAIVVNSVGDNMTVIDTTTTTALDVASVFPKTEINVISVLVGNPQPVAPDGELAVWMITTNALGAKVSSTDLRTTITDELLHTQTKTFYSDKKGACHFDLSAIDDENAIVHIDFLRANEQDAECGMLVAGEGKDMGKTMSDVELTTKPYETTYDRVANFETSVYQKDVVLTANAIDSARFQECLFIVDSSENSQHQGFRIAGTVDDVSYRATNNSRARIKNRISGFPLIDEQPIGLESETYFELGVNPLWILKGSGKIGFGRTTDTTRISPDYDKLETVLEGEVVYESEGIRGANGFTNYSPFSEDCTAVDWTSARVTPTQDGTLAPDGTSQMWKITGDGTVNTHYIDNRKFGVVSNDETWNNSLFIKKDDADIIRIDSYFIGGTAVSKASLFTFSTKSMSTTDFDFEELADGIFRVWCIFTNNATGNTDNFLRAYSNSGASEASTTSVYVWGSGMTDKSFLVPYAPTPTATPVTVAGDIIDHDSSDINIPDLTSDWSLEWSGTPDFEVGDTVAQYIIRNYTDINNFIKLYINNDEIIFSINSGGTQKDVIYTTAVSGTGITTKVKCESGFVSLLIDGTQVDITDFSAVLDVPIADKTYITSAGASTPNSNSLMYTTKYTWSES